MSAGAAGKRPMARDWAYLRSAIRAYSGRVAPDPGSCSIGRSQLQAGARSFLFPGAQDWVRAAAEALFAPKDRQARGCDPGTRWPGHCLRPTCRRAAFLAALPGFRGACDEAIRYRRPVSRLDGTRSLPAHGSGTVLPNRTGRRRPAPDQRGQGNLPGLRGPRPMPVLRAGDPPGRHLGRNHSRRTPQPPPAGRPAAARQRRPALCPEPT